ncbi:uncharacterized protein LOC114260333 [Camellia sinensis]|uniref:uncharacterized protein LOC114260333 n=1 Tax=Camellia sinensis TaxID=4442 RepID=UPI0010361180|nr:uncharacterized protein LOC114260333 [Camellia sinensis]
MISNSVSKLFSFISNMSCLYLLAELMLFGLVSLVMGHWINQVKALLHNFPSCWLQPGMVTTDLLLSGASTKQAKFFINVLAQPAEVVAEYLVPNIRSVPANGLSKPTYIQFLTGLKVYSQIFSVKWKKKMKRNFDSWFSIFKLWLLIVLFFGSSLLGPNGFACAGNDLKKVSISTNDAVLSEIKVVLKYFGHPSRQKQGRAARILLQYEPTYTTFSTAENILIPRGEEFPTALILTNFRNLRQIGVERSDSKRAEVEVAEESG